jgi:hypothetical protein
VKPGMAMLLMLNLERLRKMKSKKTYSTRQAATKMRVSFRTLNRWLAGGLLRPSIAVSMGASRTLWRWTQADIAKAEKVRAAIKPGPKKKGRGK